MIEVKIENEEGVVVISHKIDHSVWNKFPKPPPKPVQPRVYVRSPKQLTLADMKARREKWNKVKYI